MAENENNFPQTQEGVRNLNWVQLRKMLEPDREPRSDRDPHNYANLEMARRIVGNDEKAVNYYMGYMNKPLVDKLEYIYIKLMMHFLDYGSF